MISKRLAHGISPRAALCVSLVLHLVGAGFLALIDIDKITGVQLFEDKAVLFELVADEDFEFDKNSSGEQFTRQNNSSETEKPAEPHSSASNGPYAHVTGNTTVRRENLLLASLNTLDELRPSFNFMVQQVAADSVGAFAPIQGIAPDTKSLTEALTSGILKVSGFGHGNCPPRGGGILKYKKTFVNLDYSQILTAKALRSPRNRTYIWFVE
ncbi:MAG: hypothetical protein ACE5IY_21320 [bacterium]